MALRVNKIILLFISLFIVFNVHAQEDCAEHLKYGTPSQATHLLCRLGFAESYNADRKVADWVVYHLTREKVGSGGVERSDDFRPDPELAPDIRAELSDY